jgi:hypothetical protein
VAVMGVSFYMSIVYSLSEPLPKSAPAAGQNGRLLLDPAPS